MKFFMNKVKIILVILKNCPKIIASARLFLLSPARHALENIFIEEKTTKFSFQ